VGAMGGRNRMQLTCTAAQESGMAREGRERRFGKTRSGARRWRVSYVRMYIERAGTGPVVEKAAGNSEPQSIVIV